MNASDSLGEKLLTECLLILDTPSQALNRQEASYLYLQSSYIVYTESLRDTTPSPRQLVPVFNELYCICTMITEAVMNDGLSNCARARRGEN